MDRIEFIATFISILIGLGITHMMYGVHRLLRNRNYIKWNWLPMAWTLFIFITLVNTWYALHRIMETPLIESGLGFALWILPIILFIMSPLEHQRADQILLDEANRLRFLEQPNFYQIGIPS